MVVVAPGAAVALERHAQHVDHCVVPERVEVIGPIEHALQVVRARIRCACSDPRAELVPACSAPLEVEEELVGIARDDLEAERRRAGVYAPRVTWGTVRESSRSRAPASQLSAILTQGRPVRAPLSVLGKAPGGGCSRPALQAAAPAAARRPPRSYGDCHQSHHHTLPNGAGIGWRSELDSPPGWTTEDWSLCIFDIGQLSDPSFMTHVVQPSTPVGW